MGLLRRVAHKFGGSSLADAERFRAVAQLLSARPEPEQIVVVSAIQGVTDALLRLAQQAANGDSDWGEGHTSLRERHRTVAHGLLGDADADFQAWLEARFAELAGLLQGLSLLRMPAPETVDRIQGLGEVYSARLLAAHFAALGSPAALLDARDILVVAPGELGVAVDWADSAQRLKAWRADHPQSRVVVTGFVARDARGRPTTLGRNGSDYSGAIFGALFGAEEIHIWTDVDGVLSADPRLVPEAVLIPHLSYDEACELAYFGAKVVHPQTMAPAIARGIPLRIRNTFRPDHPGTLIDAAVDRTRAVKGISTMGGLALLNVEGAGMIGVPGTAERVFGALRAARVSVVMISQGSSEHSICCLVRESEAQLAETALREAFAAELEQAHIERITVQAGISALATVGDGMAGTPGIAARLFQSLARPGVNVRAIAQGASERNISVAISSADASRALRAVHAGFYLSPQTVSLGLVGPGQVGRAFLQQLQVAAPRLRQQAQLDLRIRAVADSRRMVLEELAVAPVDVQGLLAAATREADLDALATHVRASHLPHAVLIDCSASGAVADAYAGWLSMGIHIITPNKHAGSGPLARYSALRRASALHGSRFRYEATVGAGLPIITTLRDLLDTGDEVLCIEGILSGTLAYLFNRFDGTTAFSSLLREARAAGYTEPDPRDDLNGMDVARKLVILGREMNSDLELSSVAVQGLVPPGLQALSREEFLTRLPEMDQPLAARVSEAQARGHVLRYVARLDREGGATVGLTELPADHPFAHGQATDNIVRFTTARYRERPLVVQGPGAGPEVTAAGIFADLLRITACSRCRRERPQATASAPASVGNVGVGFDILGHSLEGPADRVTVARTDEAAVRITRIGGVVQGLPLAASENTAGRALIALCERLGLAHGFEVSIEKGIPLGSGMGGSAASCVAALVAANAVLDTPVGLETLYPCALLGESVASGSLHGDNVGPMLLGGLVLATSDRLVPVPVPTGLSCVLVHPHQVLETRTARAVLARPFLLPQFVAQSANLALVLAGCYRDDLELIRAGLRDVLVEPLRAPLVPGFAEVQAAALSSGALGASISGGGPSVFAWCTLAAAPHIAEAMAAAFAARGIGCDVVVSPVAGPAARVLACTS